jgi:hypothetical protein
VDIKLIESLFLLEWLGWKIRVKAYVHHAASYSTRAGRLARCVLFTLFIYDLFNNAVNVSGCMALTESEAHKLPPFYAEVRTY